MLRFKEWISYWLHMQKNTLRRQGISMGCTTEHFKVILSPSEKHMFLPYLLPTCKRCWPTCWFNRKFCALRWKIEINTDWHIAGKWMNIMSPPPTPPPNSQPYFISIAWWTELSVEYWSVLLLSSTQSEHRWWLCWWLHNVYLRLSIVEYDMIQIWCSSPDSWHLWFQYEYDNNQSMNIAF